MAHTCSIIKIGDKVVVGALDTSFLPGVPKVFPGTVSANGPCFFGLVPNIGIPQATVMIGPPIGIPAPTSLQVDGISIFRTGITNFFTLNNYFALCTKYAPTIRNSTSITNGNTTHNGLTVCNGLVTINASLNVAAGVTIGGAMVVGGMIRTPNITAGHGQFGSVGAPFKFFDIPHPSKEFPHRLRYSCLEGPEIGVYVRGVLQGTNEIELPYYWNDLVDEDTITVQLTPIGSHQSLCYAVAKMKDRISILVNPHGFNTHTIRCSYTVYAERKDVKKLVTEYEGATE